VFSSHDSSKLADKDYYENILDLLGSEYSDYGNPCDKIAYFNDYFNVETFSVSGNGESKFIFC